MVPSPSLGMVVVYVPPIIGANMKLGTVDWVLTCPFRSGELFALVALELCFRGVICFLESSTFHVSAPLSTIYSGYAWARSKFDTSWFVVCASHHCG